jgi:hypothetical protein
MSEVFPDAMGSESLPDVSGLERDEGPGKSSVPERSEVNRLVGSDGRRPPTSIARILARIRRVSSSSPESREWEMEGRGVRSVLPVV